MDKVTPKLKDILIPKSFFVILFCIAVGISFGIALDFSLLIPVILFSGVGLFILFLERPLVFLALLVIIRMSLDYSSQSISFTIQDLTLTLSQLVGLSIALLGFFVIITRPKELALFRLKMPFLLLILWGVFTLLYSIAPFVSLTEIIRIFDLFVIAFLAFVFINKTQDYFFLLGAILFSALLPSIMALYQFVFQIGFVDADVVIPRIYGTFAHPNTLSLFLFSLLVVTLIFTFTKKKASFFASDEPKMKPSSLILLAFFGLFGFLLLLTFARVAWIVTFLFALFYAFFRHPRFLLPLIVLPLILVLLSPSIQERIGDTLSPDPDSSIVWRKTLWNDVITKNLQDDRLLLGSGINTFPLFADTLRETLPGSNDAHNDLVKFFIEGGLVGLLVFFLFYLLLFRLLFGLKNDSTLSPFQRETALILILFLSCLLVASLSDNVFKNTPVQWIFFLLLGALLALTDKPSSLASPTSK